MSDKKHSHHVLVTGAAGFIGSSLCEHMDKQGFSITGIDNFHQFYSPKIKERNLRTLIESPRFRLVRGDICDPHDLEKAFLNKPTTVVHLAALAGVRPSMQLPFDYQRVNVGGTLAILEACKKHGVEHLVFGSSSSVYGNSPIVPFREDDPALQPLSVYAATKRAGELLCHTYHYAYHINITMLRFFTVYGPRQRPDLAIHKFARLMLEDQPIPFFGDGSMERDYTYIDDIVEGVLCAMEAPAGLRLFNLGSDHPVRLDKLVDAIGNALGRKAVLQHLPPPVGDVRRTWADLTKSNTELDYRPTTNLENGLRNFIEWLSCEME